MQTKIYLAQTDTTVGFLSKSVKRLNKIKNRSTNKPCIKVVASLDDLKRHVRVPNNHKNLVRRSKKSTFIYPNGQSFRVVTSSPHKDFVKKHGWLYSTSANLSGYEFDESWARSVADEVVGDGFASFSPSNIVKLGKLTKDNIR